MIGRATLIHGDALQAVSTLADSSIDSIVTDPPAGIGFMDKGWDSDKGGRDQWIAWLRDIMREALRTLKPGGHALVWALPRTSHWTATALEDAGFEIRDVVTHLFGTGFPKSLDVSKAIDKAAGVTREVVGKKTGRGATPVTDRRGGRMIGGTPGGIDCSAVTAPATDAAKQWNGWGTALKPGGEHWILARKPLDGTVAANVLAHGTGALNIGACRIPGAKPETTRGAGGSNGRYSPTAAMGRIKDDLLGRWPANVTLDAEAAALLDEQSGLRRAAYGAQDTADAYAGRAVAASGVTYSIGKNGGRSYADTGGASRFFYVAKGSRAEKDAGLEHLAARTPGEATERAEDSDGLKSPRAGARNFHPTVKSIALMRWLVRLVTPPGGVVLDMFAGSGSTGVAALAEGCCFVGVELSPEYLPILEGRIRHALGAA